jgi:hypothetical protein
MRNFEISSASDEKIPFNKFEGELFIKNLLNKKLSIKRYTDLETIFFVYQAFDPNNEYLNYKDNFILKRKTKVLELYLNLDYYQLIQSDEEESLELLAETYLKGIDLYLTGRKDFDGKRFYNDVKQLFLECRILKHEHLQPA